MNAVKQFLPKLQKYNSIRHSAHKTLLFVLKGSLTLGQSVWTYAESPMVTIETQSCLMVHVSSQNDVGDFRVIINESLRLSEVESIPLQTIPVVLEVPLHTGTYSVILESQQVPHPTLVTKVVLSSSPCHVGKNNFLIRETNMIALRQMF